MLNWRNSAIRPFRVVKKLNMFKGNETGMTLIETLVALAILGIIVVAISSGLATTSKAIFITDERTTAESLTISQMEHVKNSAYIDFSDPGHGDYELIAAPDGYSVEITTIPIESDTGQPLPSGEDLGLQKMIVTAKHHGESPLTFETYKVER